MADKPDAHLSMHGVRKPNMKYMKYMENPIVMSQLLLNLLDHSGREFSLRMLSDFLVEKRETDPENYQRTGFLLYHSCGTLSVLLQELLEYYGKMISGHVTVRCSKRLINVVTLFQSVAANGEVRGLFVKSGVLTFLIPIIRHVRDDGVIQNTRAICLSVMGALCQYKERDVIEWAFENDIVGVCQQSLLVGGKHSKVIAMSILESILCHTPEKCLVCASNFDSKLGSLLLIFNNIVASNMVVDNAFPQLLFYLIRCYTILCTHPARQDIVTSHVPLSFFDGIFTEIVKKAPTIWQLLHQLHLFCRLRIGRPALSPNLPCC